MKRVKDKQIVVGADFAGFPLKEVVCAHLRSPCHADQQAATSRRTPKGLAAWHDDMVILASLSHKEICSKDYGLERN